MIAATRKKVLFRKFSLSIAVLVIILRFFRDEVQFFIIFKVIVSHHPMAKSTN